MRHIVGNFVALKLWNWDVSASHSKDGFSSVCFGLRLRIMPLVMEQHSCGIKGLL